MERMSAICQQHFLPYLPQVFTGASKCIYECLFKYQHFCRFMRNAKFVIRFQLYLLFKEFRGSVLGDVSKWRTLKFLRPFNPLETAVLGEQGYGSGRWHFSFNCCCR